jgi:hypothetical protein
MDLLAHRVLAGRLVRQVPKPRLAPGPEPRRIAAAQAEACCAGLAAQ